MSGKVGMRRHKPDEMRNILDESLRENKKVNQLGELCQKYNISKVTLYRWYREYRPKTTISFCSTKMRNISTLH